MTDAEIERALAEIREKAWDAETAHMLEDGLHAQFIVSIAEAGVEPYASQARRVLTTGGIQFSRWYA